MKPPPNKRFIIVLYLQLIIIPQTAWTFPVSLLLSWGSIPLRTPRFSPVVVVSGQCCRCLTLSDWGVAQKWVSVCITVHSSLSVSVFFPRVKREIPLDLNQILSNLSTFGNCDLSILRLSKWDTVWLKPQVWNMTFYIIQIWHHLNFLFIFSTPVHLVFLSCVSWTETLKLREKIQTFGSRYSYTVTHSFTAAH